MSYMDNVPLAQLEPHPRNVRRDLGDLTELAESIKGIGLLEPLVIAPKGKPGEGFVVIGGHRRLAAAALAGMPGVPCILRADLCTQASQIEAQLVENLQRSDLTLMEEADAYAQLELLGVKDVSIAKTTGRAVRTVKDRRALAGLPTARREEVESGRLSVEAGVKIAHLRTKWAEDATILAEIDKAGSWAFGSTTYGIDQTINRILEDRKPKPEAEDQDEDDDSLDLDGRRAERDSKFEAERAERNKKMAARQESIERSDAWLRERITLRNVSFINQMTRLAVAAMAETDAENPILLALGAPEIGPDDDEADFTAVLLAHVNGWDIETARLAAVLSAADVLNSTPWGYLEELHRFVDYLGYQPNDAERALLAGE